MILKQNKQNGKNNDIKKAESYLYACMFTYKAYNALERTNTHAKYKKAYINACHD